MKNLLPVLLLTISTIMGMTQPAKKFKSRIPLMQRLWQLCDIHRAVVENKVLIVEDYLENHRLDPKKLSFLLNQALDSNAIGSVALLLQYGAPVNIPDFTGELPLIKMIKQDNIPMIIWLRAMNADPDKENHEKKTGHEIAHEKFNQAKKGSPEEELARNILIELRAPFALTCLRQHIIKVPDELWEVEDVIMTDPS